MSKRKARSGKTAFIGIILLIAAGVWLIVRLASTAAGGVSGKTDRERAAYIESFGWKCSPVPAKVEEIRIPPNFDEAYEQYNALQREQGFDLRKYRAYDARKYSYVIKEENGDEPLIPIYAELIVIDGNIVAADIASAEANGLLTVLAKK